MLPLGPPEKALSAWDKPARRRLQRAARREAADAFGSTVIEAAKAEAGQEARDAAVEAKGLEPLASDASLSAGDAVAVLKRGPFFARRAKVEAGVEIKFRAPHAIDATCFRSCVGS